MGAWDDYLTFGMITYGMITYGMITWLLAEGGYCKIPKIIPSKYKPPKNGNAKNPPLNRPPGGLYLEFALEYKVKQSKNDNFSDEEE